jgi:hypothetical protein
VEEERNRLRVKAGKRTAKFQEKMENGRLQDTDEMLERKEKEQGEEVLREVLPKERIC